MERSPDERMYKDRLNEIFLSIPRLEVTVRDVLKGSTVYRCYLNTPPLVDEKRIQRYAGYIAKELRLEIPPIVQTLYEEGSIVIDIPNTNRVVYELTDYLNDPEFVNCLKKKKYLLPFVVGVDNSNKLICGDLTKAPHVLIAGQSGSGKTTIMKSLINSMIAAYTNVLDYVEFVFLDPKGVEFVHYTNLPSTNTHASSPKQIREALCTVVQTMEDSFVKMKEASITTGKDLCTIEKYNAWRVDTDCTKKAFPYIILVVDELADIFQNDPELESLILRVVQKGRAVGIHCILSTQRPSNEIISGPIRANVPVKICCKTARSIDARVVFGDSDHNAQNLLLNGDLVYISNEFRHPLRLQGMFSRSDFIDRYKASLDTNFGKVVNMRDVRFPNKKKIEYPVMKLYAYDRDEYLSLFK